MVLAARHEFAEAFKELRLSRGWTQDQIANMIGASRPSISRYERGLIKPSDRTAYRICKVFPQFSRPEDKA